MTANERASQIWPVLALAARNRQTILYETLAQLIGVSPPPALGKLLEPILRYCARKGLPHLTVLVVKRKTGLPGIGFTPGQDDVPTLQAEVYNFKWPSAPTPEKFAA